MERKALLPDQTEHIDRQLHAVSEGDLIEIIYYDGDAYVKKTGLISGVFPEKRRSGSSISGSTFGIFMRLSVFEHIGCFSAYFSAFPIFA